MNELLESFMDSLRKASELARLVSTSSLNPGTAVWLAGVDHHLRAAQSCVDFYFVKVLVQLSLQLHEIQPLAQEVFDRFDSLRCKTEKLRARVTGLVPEEL